MLKLNREGNLDLRAAKILVVDDQVINIQAVNAILSPLYSVLFATNSEDALDIVAKQLPDLILMDVVMPGMGGKEACMALKQNELTADIPVIFITSMSGEKDENECWESGGVDFIQKPFNPYTLKNRVRAHLELKYQKDVLLKLAYSDGLTGVYNRRYFDEHFSKLVRLSYRNNTCVSVLLMDIDYFKKFNDKYGHIAGDEALRSVARAISSSLNRPADFAARYGGEEFIAVLPDTDSIGAEHVTANIIKAVHGLAIPHSESEHKTLTLSIGVLTLRGSTMTEEEILEQVDKSLYEAKEQGRNRFVAFQLT